jgi:hypothetical protein
MNDNTATTYSDKILPVPSDVSEFEASYLNRLAAGYGGVMQADMIDFYRILCAAPQLESDNND